MERTAGDVVEHEVVQGDVEDLGDAGEHVEGRGDSRVLVTADLAGVAADAFEELALGLARLGAEVHDAVTEGHGVVSGVGPWIQLEAAFSRARVTQALAMWIAMWRSSAMRARAVPTFWYRPNQSWLPCARPAAKVSATNRPPAR